LNDAYHPVTTWSNDPSNVMNIIGPTNDGLSFAQATGSKNTGTKTPADPTTMQCFSCKEMVHTFYECPNPKAPTATATVPNKTAMNHVHTGSDKF